MTKKSASRIERDLNEKQLAQAQKDFEEVRKANKSWDELNQIYAHCKTMLLSIPGQISDMYSVEKIEKFIPNKAVAADCIRCLSADLKVLNADLEQIHKSHEGKTGICVDDDDFISSLTIAEAYNAFRVKFEGVIMPTVNTLSIQFDQAVEKVKDIISEETAKPKISPELDVNVVTDAKVKENNE